MENGAFAPLLQWSKCSNFHNIFKYMIFQRRQKALLWSEGLRENVAFPHHLSWIDLQIKRLEQMKLLT